MSDNLVVKSRIRELLDGNQVGAEFYETLDEEVERLVNNAADRAEANSRKTVQARDV